jgi:hypothetical protein
MNESEVFRLDRLLSLTGGEMVKYVEPFVNERMTAIPELVYEPLQSKLADMDDEHALYALEICMLLKPSEFLLRAITFLSHPDAAVCCAAYNSINGLPQASMPADLVAKVATTPKVDLFAPDLRSGDRIRIGTNEWFIHDLVAKFAQKTSEAT